MGNEQALKALRRAAWRLAAWQLAVTAVLAVLAWFIGGGRWALSALTGGGIGAAAGLYQALRMFRVDASRNPAGYLSSVYAGEALKIILTVALFIVAIRTLQVELVPVIVAYAATFGVYWAALSTDFPWFKSSEPGN